MLQTTEMNALPPSPLTGGMPEAAQMRLPWQPGHFPLMLAPMQGLTNRALRSLFAEWVRPDVLFTEFMRVNPVAARKRLRPADLAEAASGGAVPLVAQLIGHGRDALVSAALAAQEAGARHINLNMGCPFGRTTSGLTGGGMLRRPEELTTVIPALRRAISGSFSIKLRAGYDNPRQIFDLLPLLEAWGVDFLVLHPRTVVQKYAGFADHGITARVVAECALPVIANGDIRSAATGLHVRRLTGAAGLMLGRGAISDPLLFQRLRGEATPEPGRGELASMLRHYLEDLLNRYRELYCGEAQVLARIRDVIATCDPPPLDKELNRLKRVRNLDAFREELARLA